MRCRWSRSVCRCAGEGDGRENGVRVGRWCFVVRQAGTTPRCAASGSGLDTQTQMEKEPPSSLGVWLNQGQRHLLRGTITGCLSITRDKREL